MLRAWVNTFLAETWEESHSTVEAGDIITRAEKYGPEIPADVLVLVAGVDVQNDRIEVEVAGYGDGEESWGITCHQIWGSPELDRTWTELDQFLLRDYMHANGHKLRVAACCIDSGFKTKSFYAFVRPRIMRRVFAVKGSALPNMPLVTRPQRSSVRETLLFPVGSDTAKEIIYSRLLIETRSKVLSFPCGLRV